MTQQQIPDTENLTVARLAAAVALATSIAPEGFDELLDRFREAYEAVVEVTDDGTTSEPEIIVRLPRVDAPEIPSPPAPSPPTFERNGEE